MKEIGAKFILMPSETLEPSQAWTSAGYVKRTSLDLYDAEKRGLWPRRIYRQEQPYLLLLEATAIEPSLMVTGDLLEIQPNRIRMRLDGNGEGIARFLHAPGWEGPGDVIVDACPGAIPWIRVRGTESTEVEIHFGPPWWLGVKSEPLDRGPTGAPSDL